ncbi:MAG: hypothetical protein LAO31_18460 [Acidobacteriia bacterium]|nr:hypothetical protein [Terriglobia bacterium]
MKMTTDIPATGLMSLCAMGGCFQPGYMIVNAAQAPCGEVAMRRVRS